MFVENQFFKCGAYSKKHYYATCLRAKLHKILISKLISVGFLKN